MNLPTLQHNPKCDLCPLHSGAHSICVPTVRYPLSLPSPAPPVIMLGQNPGYDEDRLGEPFVGRSGSILKRSYIEPCHLHLLSSIYFTNSVRCYTPRNTEPPLKPRRICSTAYLLPDLLSIASSHSPPYILILLGGVAAQTFFTYVLSEKFTTPYLKQALARSGSIYSIPSASGPVPFHVFTTYHPAFIARTPSMIEHVVSHLSPVTDLLQGVGPPSSSVRLAPPRGPKPAPEFPP